MKATFFKGVALGAVTSLITLGAATAYAGSGIGGVFNLGKSNSVNGTSVLGGTTAGPQLRVANSGTASSATGIDVKVPSNRPPFTVNSSAQVQNLNASYVGGVPQDALQRSVFGTCGNGQGISSVNSDGAVTCSTQVVRPFVSNPVNPFPYQFQYYAPTGLEIFTACHDPGTEFSVADNGSSGATLNWMYSLNGSTGVTASGVSLAAGGGTGSTANFGFSNRLEGQWIYSEPGYVVTINVHGFDGGVNACEFRGTVEIAPTG